MLSLWVDIKAQRLNVIDDGRCVATYPISSAKKGVGEMRGSEMTPRGWHKVRAKIGKNQPQHSVFVGRRPTGEIYTQALASAFPERDWILSRILWLSGLQKGINRLGNVDSMQRYIYIHGTNEEHLLGEPHSHGCIRMGNADIITLFDQVEVGTNVLIK